MKIYIGADHGGFALKIAIKKYLENGGHEVVDVGAYEHDVLDDFPIFGGAAAQKVSEDPQNSRAVLLCRSGVGMDIVANKFKNVRAVLALSADHVARSRHDEDTNVLSIASDFMPEAEATKAVDAFLKTPFSTEEKYSRRLKELAEFEKGK